MGNKISSGVPNPQISTEQNRLAGPLMPGSAAVPQRLTANQAVSFVNDLSAIFENGNHRILAQQRENLRMAERSLVRLNALNMRNVLSPALQGSAQLTELKHYHGLVRDRIEAFRTQNPDLYTADDPQLAHFTEAKLVYGMYDRMTQMFPGAAFGAACSELALCNLEDILQNERGTDVELVRLKKPVRLVEPGRPEPDHAFIVLGRDRETDPEDPARWNEDAVVCDASQGEMYPKAEITARFARIYPFTQGVTQTEIIARAEGGRAPFSLP